jgi:hypothetical protein
MKGGEVEGVVGDDGGECNKKEAGKARVKVAIPSNPTRFANKQLQTLRPITPRCNHPPFLFIPFPVPG